MQVLIDMVPLVPLDVTDRSPSDVRQTDSVLTIEQATVTVEWTPPPNGENLMYVVEVTPPPLSGPMTVIASSTRTNISVNYNINYTVTVRVNILCSGRVPQAVGNIFIRMLKRSYYMLCYVHEG